MAEINYDKRNYRVHSDKNKKLINKSLKECGTGRSILLDKNNEIIAGNGVYEQAQELKIPVKVIETDGKELIAIKRTDLDTEDNKRKQLAIMDNSTSDSSEFNLELIQEDFNSLQLEDFGLDIPQTQDLDDIFTEPEVLPEKKPKMIKCPACGEEFEYKS